MTQMELIDIQNTDFKQTSSKSKCNLPDMFIKRDNGKLLIRRDLVVLMKDDSAYWIVQTGQDEGKLIEKINHYTKGKGKKTAYEQALSEAKSKRTKKFKKDKYREGRANAINPANDPYPPPMLATAKEKTKIIYPCLAQRKLDGNRSLDRVTLSGTATADKVEMWSRSGNFFKGLEHIEAVLIEMAKVSGEDEIIFDGELYTLEVPFTELNGILKLDHLDPADYEDGSKQHAKALLNIERKRKIQLWVYDIAVKSIPQWKRAEQLTKICKNAKIPNGSVTSTAAQNPVVFEPFIEINNKAELDAFHAETVGQGFEGTIVRMRDAGYLFDKRSKELVKVKDFQDEEFECVGMKHNDRLPGTGAFQCLTKEGETFDAMPEGSMAERKSMYDLFVFEPKKVIGKKIRVKFFDKNPKTGIPRFPVAQMRDEL